MAQRLAGLQKFVRSMMMTVNLSKFRLMKSTNVTSQFIYIRLCFFTTSEAKSTRTFVKVLNESVECGSLMCQLFDSELNKYIMNLTTEFRREQKRLGQQKNQYIKTAAICLGKQPDSSIWVLNSEVSLHGEIEMVNYV